MLVGILAVWVLFEGIFLFVWARLHAAIRAAERIDEALYIEGLDERSLAEGA
jgi:hypothetical protein